jgi:adenine-specific DNA glycosylase
MLFCISEVLVVKRPESGLLAGQYEFPSAVVFSGAQLPAKLPPASELQSSVASILNHTSSPFASCFGSSTLREPRTHGSFLHVFSHLRQTSHVYHTHAGGTHGVASGVVCLVQPASVTDAESDSDQELEDDDASTATKKKSKASNDKKAGLHSASWVSWKLLSSLGLALSAQKALELVTGNSVASSTASTSKSNPRPAAAQSSKPAKKAKSENSVTAFFSK